MRLSTGLLRASSPRNDEMRKSYKSSSDFEASLSLMECKRTFSRRRGDYKETGRTGIVHGIISLLSALIIKNGN